MRILCVCNQGRHRSRTAAELLAPEHETRYRGIYNNLVTAQDIVWADIVLVMEGAQRKELAERFPSAYLKVRIITLDIPDIYSYAQPELITALRDRIVALLEATIATDAMQNPSSGKRASPKQKVPANVE